ncbi:acylphosphatase [Spectribacter hydrogenoxidans]|uniref:acylphosphatase n=1 Tax=Spectribacter hydrogenoxidans TaxID=3075608 RepID=A0ABU3C2E6_9GAMM|nr:acylphosphatase [Salinisphaera sp. W335]MDT0635730.1 acylphosphatase [Salinisphaera sp. W335]
MSTHICRQFRVTGRVQGVFFRASARQEAKRLGLTGHARNEPDGSVTGLICGDREAIAAFEAWLWQGPDAALVSRVELSDSDADPPTDFGTG